MELFKLFGTIAIQNADANEQIDDTTDRAKESESKISSAFKKIGGVVATAFAVDTIKDFGLNCINAAADANAASSQFSQVFGDMEGQAKKSLTGIADNTGIQVNRMKGSYTQIAAFAKTTGMDTSNALGLADRAMVAVADSAAFYDRTLEDTTESLQSFLKGNYENDSALGLSCTEVTRNEAANRLYGKSFKDLSEAQKQLTLLQMVEDANKASGALGQAARESDTWTNQTGNLKQAWTDFQSVLGQKVLPLAVEAVKKASEVVQGLSEKMPTIIQTFKDWSPLIAGVVTGFVTLKAAMAISSLISAVTTAWTAYKTANEGATIAQWLLNAALNANPIVLIVSLIAGLVVAIITLWNTNEDFRNKVIEIWEAIKNFFSNAIEGIKNFFSGLGESIGNTVNKIGGFFSDLKEKASTKFSEMKEAASQKFSEMKERMGTIMQAAKDTVFQKLQNMKDVYNEHGGGIKGIASAAMEGVKGYYSAGYTFIDNLTNGKLSQIANKFKSKMSEAKEAVSSKIAEIKSKFSEGLSNALSTVGNILTNIKNKFSSILEGAKNIVRNAINTIKGFFNFSWSLPKIKLPHFSISGKFSLNPPQIPHFSVSWYKKAMDNPVMFTKPTIFSMNPATGQAKGAGEAGDELMIGKETMLNMIRQAVTEGQLSDRKTELLLQGILNWLSEGGLKEMLVDILVNYVSISINDREVARVVRKYA